MRPAAPGDGGHGLAHPERRRTQRPTGRTAILAARHAVLLTGRSRVLSHRARPCRARSPTLRKDMNKTHAVIWNASKACWTVASECARRRFFFQRA
ncbi:ESPR-type extended signal peptide-containing protein [Achromobacter denitrificans]|uniref:ESPR-type extended signal peptide-containing protein n=1 Tax=Achromobacter denitrificans TaxID=32002 RepID=UPI0034A0CE44